MILYLILHSKLKKYESQFEEKNKEICELNDKLLKSSSEHKIFLDLDKMKYQGEITKLNNLLKEKDLIIEKMEQDLNVTIFLLFYKRFINIYNEIES